MERWAESDWKLPVISGLLLAAAYLLPLLVPNFICFIGRKVIRLIEHE